MDGREVFEAILAPRAGASEHYDTRVQGKRIQLANVDRAAPRPASTVLERQAERAKRRMRRAQGKSAPQTRHTGVPPRPRSLPYANAVPLYNLWLKYVQDWIGAKLTVVQSTNPSLIHLHGIVVQETHETFLLVPENSDRVRMVPKQNTVFQVAIPAASAADAPRLMFELYGNQMRYTLPARATRKHKARKTVELG